MLVLAAAVSTTAVVACSSTDPEVTPTGDGTTTGSDGGGSSSSSSGSTSSSSGGSSSGATPTCTDGSKNGAETDIDCGGTCTTKCAEGKACTTGADCATATCDGNTKKCVQPAPTCTDGKANGTESDVDCGAACPNKCADAKGCATAGDCASGVCDGTTKKCKAAACNDTVKNGTESDVDCGGAGCPKCADTKTCAAAGDCASGVCDNATKKCKVPACDDTVKNGTETDIDCGGSCQTACANGKGCAAPADCTSHVCTNSLCVAADPGWTYKDGYWQLSHDAANQPFTASDCDPPSFDAAQAMVNGIPYDVGDVMLAKQAALPEGPTVVNAPFSSFSVNNVYMLLPGGRGGARQFVVTFTYADDTTVAADPYSIPHDCGGGGPFTDDLPVQSTVTSQGTYPKANTCCNNWWDAVFTNPQPAKKVKSITMDMASAGNAGWGMGRVWAVTIN